MYESPAHSSRLETIDCHQSQHRFGGISINFLDSSGLKSSSAIGRRKVLTVLILTGVVCYLFFYVSLSKQPYVYKVDSYSLPCEMPVLDPYDAEQMKNMRHSEPYKCAKTPFLVYVDKENLLRLNISAVNILKLDINSITCQCQVIKRGENSDDSVFYSDTVVCTPPYNIPSDFFKIKCVSKENELLNTILTKIHRQENNYKRHSEDFYSVILFGLDSVSRNNAIRQMPRVVQYLQENMSSIDLLMYNRIGGHTFDNLVPMLTGLLANTDDIPYLNDVGTRYEKLPFIWKNFSRNHYVTFYAEDNLQFHTFNFKKEGFKRQPTDHYMRPFWMADYESRPTKLLFWKEDISSFNKRKCLANIPKYLVQITYLKQFINTYKDVRKFGMSHLNDLSHENVNDLHLAENDFIDFFRWFKHGGHLDNTFLIIYSDHGPRGQSQTHQSLLETNLPYLSIIPPTHFRKSFPDVVERMRRNAHVLTTHFDLFATLSDILQRQFNKPSVTYVHNKPRGISLFRDIQKQRSCSESSIPDQFCMCYRSQRLNITNNHVINEIAQYVVDKLNKVLDGERQCAQLRLKAVLEAHVLVQGQEKIPKQQGLLNKFSSIFSTKDYADYKVVIQTDPGNGKFFATSKIDSNGKRYILDNIERVNRYNNDSYCVSKDKIRPICYCTEK